MKNIKPENGIDELLVRCIEGVAGEDEYDRAWLWATQSPEHKAYYRNMFDVVMASNINKPVDPAVQERVWAKIERKIQKTSIKPNRWISVFRWTAAAAVVVFAFMAGIHILYEHPEDDQHVIRTVKGKTVVELNDGSKVWLNDETSLTYPEPFGKKSREVNLSGEAYFEVAKHAGKPFVVKTGELNIEVLGTQFNVRASENEKFIRTTLIEGSVKIQKNDPAGGNGEIILAPGQQLEYDKQDSKISLREVNTQLYTAWKEGQLIFEREQMGEVFAVIEQNFDVTIILKNKKLTERRLTGRFSLDEKPEKILALMQQIIPFSFQIQNDTIFIK